MQEKLLLTVFTCINGFLINLVSHFYERKENNCMKKYEYVNVEYKMKDMVMASLSDHRSIIAQYAGNGYRYAGMIPSEISAASGKLT